MLATKRVEAGLDAVDEVAEEPDRVGDDVADHARGLRRTFSSMSLSLRIVLTTPDDGVERLATRPLLAALSSSMRESSASRDSTYFCASVSTSASCLESTSLESWSNCSSSLPSASLPTFCRSGGSWAT